MYNAHTLGDEGDGMELWELAARERIRELVASYTHLGDAAKLDHMIELFHEDAQLDAFGTPYRGHAAIRGFFAGIADGSTAGPARTFIRHYIANVTIDVTNPTEATGASYWHVLSDVGAESSGRYWDTYRRGLDGTWRFATRRIKRDVPRVPVS